MCSCDTSSGRTVSAQRQAAFSSCSRGAMALPQGAPPQPGRRRRRHRHRRRLRRCPTGLRHLPAKRTRRSLSQLASQSPVRATAAAPARPRARAQPARPAAKRRRRHPTPPAPADVGSGAPCRGGRMRVPSSPCVSRASNRTGGGRGSVGPRPSCHVLTGAARAEGSSASVRGSAPRTAALTSPRSEKTILSSGTSPLSGGFAREATQRTP